MTAEELIARSIARNEIVNADYEAELAEALSRECDDGADASDTVTEYWGVDIDGNGWRVHLHGERADIGSTYTYTIFDADPNSSSGCAWPDQTEVEIEARDDEEALDAAREALASAALECGPDEYDAGQKLHMIVWDEHGVIVGQPTHTLSSDELGIA